MRKQVEKAGAVCVCGGGGFRRRGSPCCVWTMLYFLRKYGTRKCVENLS